MVRYGYTLMTEQSGPAALVRDALTAERAGFDFEVMSDHYFPWLDSQGHAPNVWVTLGAVASATEQVELMTYVTCPIMRYHPAVVAQQAATAGLLSGGRFTLGLGAGENLNEHIVGRGLPRPPCASNRSPRSGLGSTAIIASACRPAIRQACSPEPAIPTRGGGSPTSHNFAESTR